MRYPDGSVVRLFDIVDGGDGEATIVGIVDSNEYAPAFQPPVRAKRGAGVLVIFDDGTLRWRPFPGFDLRLHGRPSDVDIKVRFQEDPPRLLPVAAIPAYHGFYVDGQRIELLDQVEVGSGDAGRVVAIIWEGRYSAGFEAQDWSYLRFGFLVESSNVGLQWFKDADEDLKLLRRFDAQGRP